MKHIVSAIVIIGTIARVEFSLRGTALMLLAVTAGGHAFVPALIGAASVIPTVFMSSAVVALTDRFGAWFTILIGIVLNGVFYVALIPTTELVSGKWTLCIFALGFGVTRPLIDNSINFLISEMTNSHTVERTNGILSVGQNTGGIIGPSMAGLLYAYSPIFPFVIAILIAAISVMFCITYMTPRRNILKSRSIHGGSSFRLIRKNHVVLKLSICGFLSNIFAGCFTATIPVYLISIARMTPSIYGINSSMISIGVVIASIVFIFLVSRWDSIRIAMIAGIVSGIAMMGMAMSLNIPTLLTLALLFGLGLGGWNSGTSSALLRSAEGEGMTRTVSLYRSIVFAGSPFGSTIGGLVILHGARFGVFISGLGQFLCGCLLVITIENMYHRTNYRRSVNR